MTFFTSRRKRERFGSTCSTCNLKKLNPSCARCLFSRTRRKTFIHSVGNDTEILNTQTYTSSLYTYWLLGRCSRRIQDFHRCFCSGVTKTVDSLLTYSFGERSVYLQPIKHWFELVMSVTFALIKLELLGGGVWLKHTSQIGKQAVLVRLASLLSLIVALIHLSRLKTVFIIKK